MWFIGGADYGILQYTETYFNTMHYVAAHCNTLQHTKTVMWFIGGADYSILQYTETYCNTIYYVATHCNTVQHNTTHHNKLQHTNTVMWFIGGADAPNLAEAPLCVCRKSEYNNAADCM